MRPSSETLYRTKTCKLRYSPSDGTDFECHELVSGQGRSRYCREEHAKEARKASKAECSARHTATWRSDPDNSRLERLLRNPMYKLATKKVLKPLRDHINECDSCLVFNNTIETNKHALYRWIEHELAYTRDIALNGWPYVKASCVVDKICLIEISAQLSVNPIMLQFCSPTEDILKCKPPVVTTNPHNSSHVVDYSICIPLERHGDMTKHLITISSIDPDAWESVDAIYNSTLHMPRIEGCGVFLWRPLTSETRRVMMCVAAGTVGVGNRENIAAELDHWQPAPSPSMTCLEQSAVGVYRRAAIRGFMFSVRAIVLSSIEE